MPPWVCITWLNLPVMPPRVYMGGYTSLLCFPGCIWWVSLPTMPPWVYRVVYTPPYYASLGVYTGVYALPALYHTVLLAVIVMHRHARQHFCSCHQPGYASQVRKEALFPARINPLPARNRRKRAKKPATESPVVQGTAECANPS